MGHRTLLDQGRRGERGYQKHARSIALRVGAMVASATTGIITARLLAPAERGTLALMAVPVTYAVAFAGTGMRQPVAKRSLHVTDHSVTSGTMLIATLFGVVVAMGWGAARVGALSALTAGALCAGMVVFAFLEALAIAAGKVHRVLKAQLATQAVFLLGAPILYLCGFATPTSLVIMQLFGILGIAFAALRDELGTVCVAPRFSGNAVVISMKYASGTLAITALCRVDVIAAALVLPKVALGQYVVAAAFGEFLAQFPAFAGFLLFSETTPAAAGKRRLLYRVMVRTFALSSMAAILLWVTVPFVVSLAIGAQYEQASQLFAWLLPGYVVASVLRVAAGVLAALGDARQLVVMSVVGAMIMVILLSVGPAAVSCERIALCAAAAQTTAAFVLVICLRFRTRYE